MMTSRIDGRALDQLRPVRIERGFNRYAEGSALVSFGDTKVMCTASVEEKTPQFLRGSGKGWVTAEYAMLPRATASRTPRDVVKGQVTGRSQEIQRLIGRSLRAAVALPKLGERTVWIDCDVIQADGGTRTAAITGGFVALVDALRWLWHEGKLTCIPLAHFVAAVSSGIVDGKLMLDLCFEEDSKASVDFNVVMNEALQFIEIQGTAEEGAFASDDLHFMLALARRGIEELIKIQDRSLQLSSEERKAIEIAGSLRQQQ